MRIIDLQVGEALPDSPTFVMTQGVIDAFADTTGDHQWIHTDPERCAKESPFKRTIAHGFLSLSLLPKALSAAFSPCASVQAMINYGIDHLRFLEPVSVNDSINFSLVLRAREHKPMGELFRFAVTCNIVGNSKPAFVAESLLLVVLAE